MQIDINPSSIVNALDGYKTYIALGVGMMVIAANHFGVLPADYVPAGLDPNNWINDEFKLVVAAFFRSGIKKGDMPQVKAAIVAFVVGAAALFAPLGHAFAADLAVKAPAVQWAPVPVVCTPSSCSGFYVGGMLVGMGGNADIVGNGINGSIFAAGGAIGLDAGYQLWNNQFFLAAEFAALYQSNPNANTVNVAPGGFLGLAQIKLGGNAAALFTGSVPAPSQGPISIPQALLNSVISPYIQFGDAIRKDGSQWVSGAGVQASIGGPWTMDVGYDYGAPTTKLNALQMVLISAAYHFKP